MYQEPYCPPKPALPEIKQIISNYQEDFSKLAKVNNTGMNVTDVT